MSQQTWADVEEAAWLSDDSLQTPPDAGAGGNAIPAWQRNDQDVTDFGPVPLGLEREVVVVDCPDCRKPVLERFLPFHRQNCALVRDVVAGKVSPSVLEGKRRKRAHSIASNDTAANASVVGGASSMAGGDSELGGPPKKKTRKEEKLEEAAARRKARLDAKEAKALKKKNRMSRGDPLNVDRQCGVITEKGPCSRSLTCKSHSMGAKRAVPGRSRPYDDLLFEWQKATNPTFLAKLKEKERVMAEAAKEREQEKARKLEAKKKRLMGAKKKTHSGAGGGGGGGGGGEGSKKKSGGGSGKDSGLGHGAKDKDGNLLAPGADGFDPSGLGGLGGAAILEADMDMYAQGASEAEVELEFEAVLEAIRSAAMAPRTMAMPLAVSGRNYGAGAYAHKAMRFRALRAGGPIF